MRVAVIGAGGMGRWFAGLFKNSGDEVWISDVDKRKLARVSAELGVGAGEPEDVAGVADLAIVAVPISSTADVVAKLARVMRRGSLLVDICSVKEDVVNVMQQLKTEAELASIHPLFGPGATDLRGKDVISIPVRVGRRYSELKRRLSEMGANVVEMRAEEHDRLMAVVQCLPHLTVLSFLLTLSSLRDFLVEDVKTPMFAHLLLAGKALLARNPSLYGEIQIHNRYATIVRERMQEVCRSLDVALSAGDATVIAKKFAELEKLFSRKEREQAYRLLYEIFEKGREE